MYSKFQITKFNILDNIPDYQHYVSIGQSIFKKNCEEINCLWLATAKGNFGFAKIVFCPLSVGMFVSHVLPPLD